MNMNICRVFGMMAFNELRVTSDTDASRGPGVSQFPDCIHMIRGGHAYASSADGDLILNQLPAGTSCWNGRHPAPRDPRCLHSFPRMIRYTHSRRQRERSVCEEFDLRPVAAETERSYNRHHVRTSLQAR